MLLKTASDIRKPVFYGTMVALLLLYRLGAWLVRRPAPLKTTRLWGKQLAVAKSLKPTARSSGPPRIDSRGLS